MPSARVYTHPCLDYYICTGRNFAGSRISIKNCPKMNSIIRSRCAHVVLCIYYTYRSSLSTSVYRRAVCSGLIEADGNEFSVGFKARASGTATSRGKIRRTAEFFTLKREVWSSRSLIRPLLTCVSVYRLAFRWRSGVENAIVCVCVCARGETFQRGLAYI